MPAASHPQVAVAQNLTVIEIVMFVARHISSLLVSAIVVNNDKVAIEDASLFDLSGLHDHFPGVLCAFD